MNFIENVKGSVSAAVETISDVAQNLVEKNRLNAQLNRLRLVMKNESNLMNRAYIALGKHYYNVEKGIDKEAVNTEKLFEIIDNSKTCIKKAQSRYNMLLKKQMNEPKEEIDITELEDITVACSNEEEYEETPFIKETEEPGNIVSFGYEQTEEQSAGDKLKQRAQEIKEKSKEAAKEIKDDVKDVAEDIAEESKEFYDKAKDFVQDTSEDIADATKNVVSDIKEAAEDADLF